MLDNSPQTPAGWYIEMSMIKEPVNQHVHSGPLVTKGDPRVLGNRDQDGRADHRPDDGPGSTQHGDEDDLDRYGSSMTLSGSMYRTYWA